MDDFVFNLLNSNDKLTENFVDMMLDHRYYPLINKSFELQQKVLKQLSIFGPMQNVGSKF